MPLLLVRPPPTTLAQGIVSHIDDRRDSVDYSIARRQWHAYIDVFRRHGWHVVEVDQDDALPDSVFVEDGVISVDRVEPARPSAGASGDCSALLILASPGNPAREGEPTGIEKTLRQQQRDGKLDGATVVQIQRPGTLDGGDVLKVPSERMIYIGESARTNADGIRQFQQFVEPLGWHVRRVPVKKALHLKSMLTALPDGTIIGFEPLLEDASVFDRFVSMPEAEGVAVVHLDVARDSKTTPLIMSASAPQSRKKLLSMGYTVVTEEIGEFEKLEGCVTCLSVRVRHG